MLKDHLGNTRATIKQDGTIVQVQDYYAFGLEMNANNQVTPSPNNQYKYNGKELNNELGLDSYDYGARFYDPVVGRWNVVDAKAEKYSFASPYNYALNNPLKYIDPDGNDIILTIRGENNQKDRTLTYRGGNAYWNDTGKKYDGRGANNTIWRVLKAYQTIEKSNDEVLKGQLHTLEKSDKKHYVEQGFKNGVKISGGELGSAEDGDRLGTTTRFNFSKEHREAGEKVMGVEISDLSTVTHELRHQFDYNNGNMKDAHDVSSAKDPAEIRAVNNENRGRKIEGLPKRTTYNGIEIDKKKLENPPNN